MPLPQGQVEGRFCFRILRDAIALKSGIEGRAGSRDPRCAEFPLGPSSTTTLGIAMNTKLWAIVTALAGAAFIALPAAAGGDDFKNLAVDIDAPGAVRAEIGISIPSLREDLRFELGVHQAGQLAGGIYIPPGE